MTISLDAHQIYALVANIIWLVGFGFLCYLITKKVNQYAKKVR